MIQRAYKFLRAGAIGPFSRHAWPAPAGDAPGTWVEARDYQGACGLGIHACTTDQIARWLEHELWVIELDGDRVVTPQQVIAQRGRLLARVDAYGPAAQAALAAVGVERARVLAGKAAPGPDADRAAGYAADAALYQHLDAAASLFCAAHAGLTEAGYAAERVWQSRWLADHLGVS